MAYIRGSGERGMQSKRLTLEGFLLIWAISMGALVRLVPTIRFPFPVNDGGLFYVMIQDLIQNGFQLPTYTTYNSAHIPFAYPPLALYLGALISAGLDIPLISLLQWLPPIITILTIPVFYLLSKTMLGSRFQAALATTAYAMLPRTYDFPSMGGGLTRSFGLLCMLLALISAFRFYTTQKWRYLLPFGAFSTLLLASHPEYTVHTCAIIALMWIFWSHTKRGIVGSLIVIASASLLSSPWWIAVILQHGLTPFTAALQTGWHHWTWWIPLVTMTFSEEPNFGLITAFAIVGIFACMIKRNYFPIAWLGGAFLAEPRAAPLSASLALALLAAIGLDEVLLPGLQRIVHISRPELSITSAPSILAWQSMPGKLLLTFFLLYALLNAYIYSLDLSSLRVTDEELKALQWVTNNIPPNARFVILNYGEPLTSPIQEWFPALTGRINLSVVQGYEWLPGEFNRRRASAIELSHCIFYDRQCIESWARNQGFSFDYVLISQSINGTSLDTNDPILGNSVAASMQASSAYRLVYSSTTVKIFQYLGSD